MSLQDSFFKASTIRGSVGGRQIGRMAKDGRPCSQKTAYLDAASVLLNQGVQSSPNIIGLGSPKGFEKPTVGMAIHQGGISSQHVDSQVTQINFTQKRNTNAQGNCPVVLQDMFVTSKCGTNGDSGSSMWNDAGYLVGIVTFGSTEHDGKNTNCKAYNPSMWRCPQILGVTTQDASQLTQPRSQQQRPQQGRGFGDYYYY